MKQLHSSIHPAFVDWASM